MNVLKKIQKIPTVYIVGAIIASAVIIYFTMTNTNARSDQLTPQKRFIGSFFQGLTSIVNNIIWAAVIIIVVIIIATVFFGMKIIK